MSRAGSASIPSWKAIHRLIAKERNNWQGAACRLTQLFNFTFAFPVSMTETKCKKHNTRLGKMSTLAKRCSQFGWFSSLELHNKVYIYSRYQKQGPAVNLSGALTLLVVEGHWVRSSLSLSLSLLELRKSKCFKCPCCRVLKYSAASAKSPSRSGQDKYRLPVRPCGYIYIFVYI